MIYKTDENNMVNKLKIVFVKFFFSYLVTKKNFAIYFNDNLINLATSLVLIH